MKSDGANVYSQVMVGRERCKCVSIMVLFWRLCHTQYRCLSTGIPTASSTWMLSSGTQRRVSVGLLRAMQV
jgi:hypothetical protein